MKKRKVLLIGWDAADWNIIQPLIDQGLMPALKSLMEEGVYGNISTLDPPLSPMLWSTIATGKRAYDHGILGFIEPTEDGNSLRPVQVTSRKVKAIWNILNQNGYKSNVVGWWPSFPAEPINGVMVSNHYQVATKPYGEEWPIPEGTIYPPEMEEELGDLRVHSAEITGAMLQPFIPRLSELNIKEDKVVFHSARYLAHASSLHNAVTHLMETTEWDFSAIYLDAIDHFSHLAMRYHPPKLDWVEEKDFSYYKEVINSAYRFHDMMLERLLKLAGEDCTIVLLSDHGFHSDHLRLRDIPKEPAGPAYEHRQYGVFLMKGPGIKKGEKIFGSSLLDVCPTLLHLFDLPAAEDMEGRVLVQAFEGEQDVKRIPSWEDIPGNHGMHSSGVLTDPMANQESVEQLIELGYVEAPETGDGKPDVQKSFAESRYYLAISYMDGRKFSKALPLLGEIHSKYPEVARYGTRLVKCLNALRRFSESQEVIQTLKRNGINGPQISYFEGIIALNLGDYINAENLFNGLLKSEHLNTNVLNQLANVYQLQERWEDAVEVYKRTLAVSATDSKALTGLGVCKYHLKEFEESLEFLLDSVDQLYYQPTAHYYIAASLRQLGALDQAAQALEVVLLQSPAFLRARKELVELYDANGNEPAKETHLKAIELVESQPVVVVSGLPRSGTSMMMQMLQAGGLPVVTDDVRVADESNPKGYFELERVKKRDFSQSWLEQARGKGIKVIAQLLPFLNGQNKYKVIFMERPLHEVLVSQQVMLGKSKEEAMRNFPLVLANQFQTQLDKVQRWAETQPHVEMLNVYYNDVVKDPEFWAKEVASFLGLEIDSDNMVRAVDNKLYRNKL